MYFNKVILVLPTLYRHPHRVVRKSSWAEGEKGLCRLCFDKSRHPASKISDFFASVRHIATRKFPDAEILGCLCSAAETGSLADFQISRFWEDEDLKKKINIKAAMLRGL